MIVDLGRFGRIGQTPIGASVGHANVGTRSGFFYEPSAYVNAVDDAISDDDERVRSAYGANFERLASLKKRYDPTNLLRLNANIRPTV